MFTYGRILLAIAIFVLGGLSGSMLAEVIRPTNTDMYINPNQGSFPVDSQFKVDVKVKSSIPVNVFSGEINFDSNLLQVKSIDYNTSIADLWAIEPWYKNGEGTIKFAGGTTVSGGFTGDDNLITITFESVESGKVALELVNAHILEHDGLGSEVPLIDTPIDALFSLHMDELMRETVFWKDKSEGTINIIAKNKTTDLSGDGKTSIYDISIFMIDFSTKNMRSDFNNDGDVDRQDLEIILSARNKV